VVSVHLRSLTAKSRNDLARVLGRTNVDHLLVLTSDFDTIEFVLLDKRRRELRGPVEGRRIQFVPLSLAVAIRLDQLIRDVADEAELARLGHVTRARLTQIMNLLNLAPDVQEQILFLPTFERGRNPLTEKQLRPIAATPSWNKQRQMWERELRVAGKI